MTVYCPLYPATAESVTVINPENAIRPKSVYCNVAVITPVAEVAVDEVIYGVGIGNDAGAVIVPELTITVFTDFETIIKTPARLSTPEILILSPTLYCDASAIVICEVVVVG